MTGSSSDDEIVQFHSAAPRSWNVVLGPPTGGKWVAGTTYPLKHSGASATNGLIRVGGDGKACKEQDGTVTVREVARTGSHVSVFAATFTVGCEKASDVIKGEIRWNSTIDYVAAEAAPGYLSFGEPRQASPKPQTRSPSTVTRVHARHWPTARPAR